MCVEGAWCSEWAIFLHLCRRARYICWTLLRPRTKPFPLHLPPGQTSQREGRQKKTTLSGYFPFFLQPLSSETSVGFKEKKKSPPRRRCLHFVLLSLFLLHLCLLLHLPSFISRSLLVSTRLSHCFAALSPSGALQRFHH